MTYQYPAAVFETEDGWTAVFPDLDGLTVSAATMEGLRRFSSHRKHRGHRCPRLPVISRHRT